MDAAMPPHLQRRPLGHTLYGRLLLQPAPAVAGQLLLWTGAVPDPGISEELQEFIRTCWHDHALAEGRRFPEPYLVPVKDRPELFFLARLPPKLFIVRPRRGGIGSALFELLEPRADSRARGHYRQRATV
jgi:hypothetical protein